MARCAAILPDYASRQRLTGLLVPDNRSLSLVGDADSCHRFGYFGC